MLGGIVINKQALKSATVKLYSVLSGIITLLATMDTLATAEPTSASAIGDGATACNLTTTEVLRVRAAMLGHNESCGYNMTLGSIL